MASRYELPPPQRSVPAGGLPGLTPSPPPPPKKNAQEIEDFNKREGNGCLAAKSLCCTPCQAVALYDTLDGSFPGEYAPFERPAQEESSLGLLTPNRF